jgi:hypothetical protein
MFGLLRNQMRQEAQRATSDLTLPRMGIVTNYDPDRYAARVKLQPEGIMTGYLPVTSPWVGNGWGFYAPPNIGDVVEVHFQQGGKEAGFIVNRFYSTKTKPVSVQSGEFLLRHKSGSFIRFTNNGDVIISAARDLIQHGGRRYVFDANGQGQIWDGAGVETWQDDDVPKPHHNHAPPKIPS